MKTKPDLATETAVRLLLLKCQESGADPVRALNERGLLLYPEVHKVIVQQAVGQVADALDGMTGAQFGRQASRSPNDMKAAIAEHIRMINRGE